MVHGDTSKAYSDERDADTMGYLWLFPNPKWVYGFNASDAERLRPRKAGRMKLLI